MSNRLDPSNFSKSVVRNKKHRPQKDSQVTNEEGTPIAVLAHEEDEEDEDIISIEKSDEEIVAKALARPWKYSKPIIMNEGGGHPSSSLPPLSSLSPALPSSSSLLPPNFLTGNLFFSFVKLFISQINDLKTSNNNGPQSYCFLFPERSGTLISRVQIFGYIVAVNKRKDINLLLTGCILFFYPSIHPSIHHRRHHHHYSYYYYWA